MPHNTSLETVIIFTQDMQKLATFYAEGLDIGPYQASPGHMGCQVGPVYFGFAQVDDVKASSSGMTVLFTVDDVEKAYTNLVESGAEIRYPPTQKPWSARLASV